MRIPDQLDLDWFGGLGLEVFSMCAVVVVVRWRVSFKWPHFIFG